MSGTRFSGSLASSSGSRPARPSDDPTAGFVDEHELRVTVIPMSGSEDVVVRYATSDSCWIEVRVRSTGQREVWDHGRWFSSQAEAAEWLAEVEAEHAPSRRGEKRADSAGDGWKDSARMVRCATRGCRSMLTRQQAERFDKCAACRHRERNRNLA
jgi:hypothetical protein